MKAIKKFAAIILVLSMLLVSCVYVFAEDGKEKTQQFNYVSFGDSITRGVCLESAADSTSIEDPTRNDGRIIKESYTYKIAEALGYTMPADIKDKNATYWPLALNGSTTSFVNDLLGIDDGYFDTIEDHTESSHEYTQMLAYFGDSLSYISEDKQVKDGYVGEVGTICSARELVANANLITIGLGNADVLLRPLDKLNLFNFSADFQVNEDLVTEIPDLIVEFEKAYRQWEHNYTKLVDFLKHNTRKDCTIVLLGVVNPIFGLNFSAEYMIPIGNVVNLLTNRMNRKIEQLARCYGFEFIDTSIAENVFTMGKSNINDETKEYSVEYFKTNINSEDATVLLLVGLHPTSLGYTQIANLVLDRLASEKKFNLDTTIKVDLGKIDPLTIQYAKVDGIARSFYVENGKLCVPCLTILAKNLTVLGHDGEQLSVYDLDYKNGYVAKRVYTTNNLTLVKGTFGNIVDALGNLISNKGKEE